MTFDTATETPLILTETTPAAGYPNSETTTGTVVVSMGGVDVITYVFNTITTTPDASSSSEYTELSP